MPENAPGFTFPGDGRRYLNLKPFTGVTFGPIGTGEDRVIHLTTYVNGLVQGEVKDVYADGRPAHRLTWKNGNLSGTEEAWWPNGNRRFFRQYNERGEQHGEEFQWHKSGQLYIYRKLENGQELGAKQWFADGRIYQNYVVSGYRNIGKNGGRLCKPVLGDAAQTKRILN
ncbi:MAG: hypothetical protein HS115_02275 [Spirochaetales bacterium]|nr:hypothetical protein [Spirochaetales bacterium]